MRSGYDRSSLLQNIGIALALIAATVAIYAQSFGFGSVGFDDPDFRTNNFDDVTFAWLAAAGFEIRLTRGRRPVALDVAVRYHANGLAEYLTEDDIVDQPDGSIRIFPNRSEANLVTFQIGAQIGLGGGGPEPGFQLRR